MKALIISAVILFSAVTASAQSDLAQALQKALDEVQLSRDLLKMKDNQIELQEKLLEQKDSLIEAYKAESQARQKVIDVLTEIKCSETQFRPLGWTIYRSKRCY